MQLHIINKINTILTFSFKLINYMLIKISHKKTGRLFADRSPPSMFILGHFLLCSFLCVFIEIISVIVIVSDWNV